MPQAVAQVTFPVALDWALDHLEEPQWLQHVCQLLEMNLTRRMRFEQSKVRCLVCCAVLARSQNGRSCAGHGMLRAILPCALTQNVDSACSLESRTARLDTAFLLLAQHRHILF